LGLAVVHGIVIGHEGAITVSSIPGQGTTFEIYLPRLEAAPAHPAHSEEAMPQGKECILFVDDEAAIAHMGGQSMLERLGYEVVVCCSSTAALATFQAAPQRYDLVITDQTMPRMTGDALARALRRIRPDIPIILCTGFSHTIDAEKAAALSINAFLKKPWETHDFARTIKQVLQPQSVQKT
jgi:CheY-like chemotaxis protein